MQAYRNSILFNDFLENAKVRLEGVNKSANAGEIAAIDTVEAKIAVQNRALSLEQAKVALMKRSLELSNFLWIEDSSTISSCYGGVNQGCGMSLSSAH